jgi:DNA repair exonuclease SbcCD ATPase subunit
MSAVSGNVEGAGDHDAQLAERERRLAVREAEVAEREERVRRAEARIEEAIAAQKETIRSRERELQEERRAREELAARRAREAAEQHEREELLRSREEELGARVTALLDLVRTGGAPELIAQRISELHEALGSPAPTAERERALEERIAAVMTRERELLRRVREVAERERNLGMAAPAEPSAGEWSLEILERLVRERATKAPERADEWNAYLFTLRPYASAEGILPASFDSVVWEVFGEEFEEARVRR